VELARRHLPCKPSDVYADSVRLPPLRRWITHPVLCLHDTCLPLCRLLLLIDVSFIVFL
jgi:hypothetical protein